MAETSVQGTKWALAASAWLQGMRQIIMHLCEHIFYHNIRVIYLIVLSSAL